MSLRFFWPETPWLLLIVRALAVYVFLMVALRLFGRRELGQMTTFDLILLLILSNAVQNSINAGDNSLGGGLVSAVALLVINSVVGWLTYHSKYLEHLIIGRPICLVKDGRVYRRSLKRERITLEELRSALRKQNIMRVSDCKKVVLEPDGTLTAQRKDVEVHSLDELAIDDSPDQAHFPP
jgi:uncharacterized membrane protein YcaP (DUF421 family)